MKRANGFSDHTFIILMSLIFFLTGCASGKRLLYMNNLTLQEDTVYSINNLVKERLIKPKDELYIRVSTFDDFSTRSNFMIQSERAGGGVANDISINLISYSVNDTGYIYFPMVGDFYCAGLTTEETAKKLTALLRNYFNQPTVTVKIVNSKVSILGEVARPGTYYYSQVNINILEALSLAGDITPFGNRKEVMIIREKENTIKKMIVNLSTDSFLLTSDFAIAEGDIIYVKPYNNKIWSTISTPWALALTSITTIVLILNYFSIQPN